MKNLFGMALLSTCLVVAGCASDDDAPADTEAVDTVVQDSAADTGAPQDTESSDTATADTTTHDTTVADTSADTTQAAECNGNSDCTWCLYPTAPATVDDCYCALCPSEVLPTSICEDNASAWFAMCNSWSVNCPVADCIQQPAAVCKADSTCGNACDGVLCQLPDCPAEDRVQAPGDCCPTCKPKPKACSGAEDCQMCSYKKAVNTVDDCYCTLCPSTPTTQAQCTAWGQQWQTHCRGDWEAAHPCPVALCLPPPELVCDGSPGACQVSPYECFNDNDCGTCPYTAAPTSPAECVCPGCPTPMTQVECLDIEDATTQHCADFDSDACVPPACAQPPPVRCDIQQHDCVYRSDEAAQPQ